MPFMIKGNLLNFLKKKSKSLSVPSEIKTDGIVVSFLNIANGQF